MDIHRTVSHSVSMDPIPFQGNKSYISTSFQQQTFSMRKSRIQNIPNYRKLGLGDNLPFVVVFQTIEIERLSTEIESNRIKIKDFERQIFNSQNYQVQIRELTEKLFAKEQEMSRYSDEVEKLNLICHQLYGELEDMKRKYREVDFTLKEKYDLERTHNLELQADIERWKVRYMAAEKSKAKELDDLRMMMESQRKSMFDREIREITIRFQTERSTLENEIRKFREALEYKNRELEEGRGKIQRLEVQLIQLQSNVGQMAEYENQLVKLSQEMLRLNDLLRIKQDEIQGVKQREYLLGQKVREQQQWEMELKGLRVTLDNRGREVEEWRIRNAKLQQAVARQEDLVRVNRDLSGKMLILQKDVQKYQVIIHSSTSQLQDWRRRFANQQSQIFKLRNQSAQLPTYQNKIGVLSAQIQRLNQVMRTKVAELQEWRSKNSKLEITINSFGNMEEDNSNLRGRLAVQTRSVEEYKHRIVMLEQELNTAKNLEIKLEEYGHQVMVLNQELERMNGVARGKAQEVEDYKIRYLRIEAELGEYRGVENRIREYENQLALLTQEVQRMNNLLRNKNDEIERLNVTIRRLQQENGLLKTNERRMVQSQKIIQNLSAKIEIHIREAGKWEDKFRVYESRNQQLEGLLFNMNQDREKLSQQLKVKIFEIDEMKSKFMRAETDMYKMKELEGNYLDMKNRLNVVTGELQRVERIARQGEAELDRQRALGIQLSFKVIILSAQIQRLSKFGGGGGMRSAQAKQLHQRFLQLQTACTQKDQQITVILQKVSTLQQQISFLGGQLQKFLTAISNYQQHAIALQQDVLKYQDYAKRIMILSAQIDRLTDSNKGLEDDIRKLRLRYADQIAAETKHEEFCIRFVMLAIELQALREKVKEKDFQFDQMRKSILDPVRNIHSGYN